MINCPKCGSPTTVTETRDTKAGSRRRRRCMKIACDYRLTTVEIVIHGGGKLPRDHSTPIGNVALVSTSKLDKLERLVTAIRGSERVPQSWVDVWTAEADAAATTGGQDA